MATAVEKIIIKHHKPTKRIYNNRGWAQCGAEIEQLIRTKEKAFEQTKRYNNMTYLERCDAVEEIRKKVEREYASFFSNGNMYDWINGNSSLKHLIEDNSKK